MLALFLHTGGSSHSSPHSLPPRQCPLFFLLPLSRSILRFLHSPRWQGSHITRRPLWPYRLCDLPRVSSVAHPLPRLAKRKPQLRTWSALFSCCSLPSGYPALRGITMMPADVAGICSPPLQVVRFIGYASPADATSMHVCTYRTAYVIPEHFQEYICHQVNASANDVVCVCVCTCFFVCALWFIGAWLCVVAESATVIQWQRLIFINNIFFVSNRACEEEEWKEEGMKDYFLR